MTHEDLIKKGRVLDIDEKAVWLVDDKIVLVCHPSYNDESIPDKYALLYDNGIRVGVVYFMGSYDIHWATFPEHRGNGYMSDFVKSGVIQIVEPDLRMTMLEPWDEDYEISKHLVERAGLLYCETNAEREDFSRQLENERRERLNAPCRCGSDEKYKRCCRRKDDMAEQDEMFPCWECDAVKSHTTATRCWKCGADYDYDE